MWPKCQCEGTPEVAAARTVLAAIVPAVREECARVAEERAEFYREKWKEFARSGRISAANECESVAVCLMTCAAAIRAGGERG
jgi:hypothetical protein